MINTFTIPLKETGLRSRLVTDYMAEDDTLKDFYQWPSNTESFNQLLKERNNFGVDRDLLLRELILQHRQYESKYPLVHKNIESLGNQNTFTVTTGHQLCLAGSPLFFIYKIISAINLAQELNRQFTDNHFVPVYWMATEDHDFEEISTLSAGEHLLKWNREAAGATGRLSLDGFETLTNELEKLTATLPYGKDFINLVKQSYGNAGSLAEATRSFTLSLFGQYGLVVIDADNSSFKSRFARVIKDELQHQSTEKLTLQTITSFPPHYPVQVKPRPLNLFYLGNNLRERIITNGNGYEILNTGLHFSSDEIIKQVDETPQFFSPNVLMRPLYQEIILPNLAYIGGPAEIAYWLELKSLFEHHHIAYPVLVPRNHALLMDEKSMRQFQKLGMNAGDLFRSYNDLSAVLIARTGRLEKIEKLREILITQYHSLADEIVQDDPTLKTSALAELQHMLKSTDHLSKKLRSSLKRKEEVRLSQLRKILEIVKPGGIPQERSRGLAEYYAVYGPQLISTLMENMSPFSDQLTVVELA